MASRIPERNPNIATRDDDQLPPLPEPTKTNGETVDVNGQVRYGKGSQPWWMKYWPYVLVAWALWFAFIGAQGFFRVENWVNYFFTGVIIVWTIYHLLAPRFKWPVLPLG
ncbi:MAG TPA: hypothetical protein VFD70_08955 [Anaerolineae bacterium]|nr:hypothetical protein [Anaerolineae bacterium]